jgi:L-seryl-tRNA(Ser) seleniumtransferase
VSVIEANSKGIPEVYLTVEQAKLGFTAADLIKRLQDGNPSVHANHGRVRDGLVVFGPTCLKPGDIAIVIERVRSELRAQF